MKRVALFVAALAAAPAAWAFDSKCYVYPDPTREPAVLRARVATPR